MLCCGCCCGGVQQNDQWDPTMTRRRQMIVWLCSGWITNTPPTRHSPSTFSLIFFSQNPGQMCQCSSPVRLPYRACFTRRGSCRIRFEAFAQMRFGSHAKNMAPDRCAHQSRCDPLPRSNTKRYVCCCSQPHYLALLIFPCAWSTYVHVTGVLLEGMRTDYTTSPLSPTDCFLSLLVASVVECTVDFPFTEVDDIVRCSLCCSLPLLFFFS